MIIDLPNRIAVVGVGGGCRKAINCLIERGLTGTDFIAVDCDAASLALSLAPTRILIGQTRLGADGDAAAGARAMEASRATLQDALRNADLVVVVAGLGGGTGSGAAPVVARLARELDALTVVVATLPFNLERERRARLADEGAKRLAEQADTLIPIPCERILSIEMSSTSVVQAFAAVDEIVCCTVRSLVEAITGSNLIDVDLNDLQTILRNGGTGSLGIGVGTGEGRAVAAMQQAAISPLLAKPIGNAARLFFVIRSGPEPVFAEVMAAGEWIGKVVAQDACILWGVMIDPALGDQVQVMLVAVYTEA